MKEFQKIAIGLLGLKNPELFAPSRVQGACRAVSAPVPGEIIMNTPFLVKLAGIAIALTVNGLILGGVEYLFNV